MNDFTPPSQNPADPNAGYTPPQDPYAGQPWPIDPATQVYSDQNVQPSYPTEPQQFSQSTYQTEPQAFAPPTAPYDLATAQQTEAQQFGGQPQTFDPNAQAYAQPNYQAAQPQFSQPPNTTPPTPIASPLQGEDELSEDQFITGGDDHSFITTVPIPAHPNTTFNEQEFLALLAGSISLTKTEKQRIISSLPNLSQYQIDELTRIFREEKKKFDELNAKHSDQLSQLEAQHKNDWNDIEMQAKQEEKKKADDDEAAALRRSLGLE